MKRSFLLIVILLILTINGITEIKFKVEELTKPTELLPEKSGKYIWENIILKESILSKHETDFYRIDYPFNVVKTSKLKGKLVEFGNHPFFDGMYRAYADHRPFILSPDMIWLLISQGFAQHVINNAEELRELFVEHDGIIDLVVKDNRIKLENADSPWEEIFPSFTKQIGTYVGKDLIDVLTSNFTTTTPTSKIASEITIMEGMKPYFAYTIVTVICGIPEITLEGTPEDWQKVLDKARYLKRYKLKWWINKLEPILRQFVKASKGKVKKRFWRNMFKYHSKKKYGAPKEIDGWIVKFFPYSSSGKRMKLKKIIYKYEKMPSETVKVDLRYFEYYENGGLKQEVPLELWAGFIGLEQNHETFSLRPKIGWMIRKKDVEGKGLAKGLTNKNDRLFIRTDRVPRAILSVYRIKHLIIEFTNRIKIPDKMGAVKINHLELRGKISEPEIDRVKKIFPNTNLIINGKVINKVITIDE